MEGSGRSDGAKGAGGGGSSNDGERKCEKKMKQEGSGEKRRKAAKHQYRRRQESGGLDDFPLKARLVCFGCGTRRYLSGIRIHPCLDVPMCFKCMEIYETGSFDKDEEGHEMYCRMCGNGGDIFWCDEEDPTTKQPCPYSFCVSCIKRHFGAAEVARLEKPREKFTCWVCDDRPVEKLRMRIPGYVPGSRIILTNEILRVQSHARTDGDRASMTPQAKNKRPRPPDEHGTGQRRRRSSLPSSSSSTFQGKGSKEAGKKGKGKEKEKAMAAESRRVLTQASEGHSLQPFALERGDRFPQRSVKSTKPSPIKSETAPFHAESTAAPMDTVSSPAKSAPLSNESVWGMTESTWRLAEPVSRWLKPSPLLTTSAHLLSGPKSALNPTESVTMRNSAPVMAESTPMYKESSAMPTESAPVSKESGSMSTVLEKTSTASTAVRTEYPLTSTHVGPISTESVLTPTETTPRSIDSAPVRPKSTSVHTKSAPMSTKLVPMSTESAAVSRKRRLMSTGSSPLRVNSVPMAPDSASPSKSAPSITRSESASSILASMWTDSDLTSTESTETLSKTKSAAVPTRSAPMAPDSASPSKSAPSVTRSESASSILASMWTDSDLTSTESSDTSRKPKSTAVPAKSAPMAPDSASPSKSAPSITRSESASSILASMWTDSNLTSTESSDTSRKTKSTAVPVKSAPLSRGSVLTVAKSTPAKIGSEPVSIKSTQKSVESAPKSTTSKPTKSAPTSTKSAPTSAKVPPTSTESSSLRTESARVSTDPVSMSTDSAPVSTKSLPKTMRSAPKPRESAAKMARPTSVRDVELPDFDNASVKSVGDVVDNSCAAGGANATNWARDGIDPRVTCMTLPRAATARIPEESRRNRDAPLRRAFTRRLPPGPGRGATLLDPSFGILEGASGSLLRGVTRSAEDSMEIGRYPYSVENGRGSVSPDSEEGNRWEVLSTDSSDNGVGSSDGDLDLGRRSGARRGRHSKVFEWDRHYARKEGLIEDLSGDMEKNVGIQVCNTVDSEQLPYFKYVTGYVMGDGVQQKINPDTMACCDCTDGCRDPNLCACLQLQAHDDGSYANVIVKGDVVPRGLVGIASSPESRGGEKGGKGSGEEGGEGRFYSDDGLLLRERRTIFECHSRCACNPKTCKNRVVSRGVHLRLQVFRCAEPEKGWGLRCLDTIPAGTFVACYLGEVLRERDVDEHGKINGDDYLFGLDFGKRQATFHSASHGQVMSPVSLKPWPPSGLEANGEESLVCPSLTGGPTWSGHREGTSAAASGVLATGERCQVVDLCDSQSDEDSRQESSGSRRDVAWKRPIVGKSKDSARDCCGGENSRCEASGSSAMRGNEQALAMFMEVTGERNREKALFFFRGAGELTDVAINHYFAFDHCKPLVFAVGDDGRSVTEDDDVQVLSGGEGVVSDAGGPAKSGRDAMEVETVEGGNRCNGEVQRREREEKQKEGAQQQVLVERQALTHLGNGATATSLDSPGSAGRRKTGDDRYPSCPDGDATSVDKAGGIGVKGGSDYGSPNEASVKPSCGANSGSSTAGCPGAGEGEVIMGSPHRKPTQALASPDRNPRLSPSKEASKSDHRPGKELEKGGGGGSSALGGGGSLVGGMNAADKALSSSLVSLASGERSLPTIVSFSSQAATAEDSAARASPQGIKELSLLMPSTPPYAGNGVSNGVSVGSAKPPQPMPRSSSPDVKNHGRPRTPPRKATPSTPGGVTTPKSTVERYGFSPMASPKKVLSTPKTAPPIANKVSAMKSSVERVSGSASNGTKPNGVGLRESSRGATEDCVNGNGTVGGDSAEDSFGTPDTPDQGHGHAASPEALVVDAKAYGNVARFMNHSCAGNLNKHMVFVESHDARMPRVAFFAPQIIQPMEELTYDYGYVVGAVEGKSLSCHCGASSCPGRLL